MPTFRFKGRQRSTGAVIEGERVALNRQALVSALRAERIMPISIAEGKKGYGIWAKLTAKNTPVGAEDLAIFTKQFSVMLEAGMPLVQSMGILAEQQENETMKKTLNSIKDDVEGGATLADAMRKHPKVFDNLFVNMISAGEAGGILDIILQRLSVFVEKIVKLRRAVISASVYPVIVITVAAGIVVAILVFVIPTFAELFKNMNAALPLPTRIVMGVSDFLVAYTPGIIVAGVALGVGFQRYYATEGGKFNIDGLTLKIPIFGAVIQKIIIARFSRTLGTLLSSGISILEALDITAHTAGNMVVEKALLNARMEVQEGKTLVEPIQRAKMFPPMVVQMIGVGEETGELDQMLQKLADFYEDEADAAIANFLTLIEPLLIVFLGGVIGGIVIAMYMPIFSLVGKLASGG